MLSWLFWDNRTRATQPPSAWHSVFRITLVLPTTTSRACGSLENDPDDADPHRGLCFLVLREL